MASQDYSRSVGISLKSSLLARLDDISARAHVSRGALIRWALYHVAQGIEDGTIILPVETEVLYTLKPKG